MRRDIFHLSVLATFATTTQTKKSAPVQQSMICSCKHFSGLACMGCVRISFFSLGRAGRDGVLLSSV